MNQQQIIAYTNPVLHPGMAGHRRFLTVKPLDNGWSAHVFFTADVNIFHKEKLGDVPFWHVAVGMCKPKSTDPVRVALWGPVALKFSATLMEEALVGVGDPERQDVQQGEFVVHCRRAMLPGEADGFSARARRHRQRPIVV